MSVQLPNITPATYQQRQPLELTWSDYRWPLIFLVSMSMMGLKFPLGYLLVPIILISSFRRDRYDFVIMLSLFFGGFGLIGENTLPIKAWDIGFVVSVIGVIVLKKTLFEKKVVWMTLIYGASLVFLATFSEESMIVQIRTIRNYLFFLYFIVPIIVFRGQKFDIRVFFIRLIPFIIILFCFYVLDCYIFNGHIMLPCTYIWDGSESVFYSPFYYGFGYFPRIYPPGLFPAVLAVYPLARFYKLYGWQWILSLLVLGATKTFTVISGLIAEYVIAMPDVKRTLRYAAFAFGFIGVVYLIDSVLPMHGDNQESTFRIYSSVRQIVDIGAAQDDEDLAELGSGRLGQAFPKFELIDEMGKQATGLGFLHAELTTNPKYIIDNPFYSDISRAEEVATGIEVEPLQVYLSAGYIGLIIHFVYIFLTYYFVRKFRYSFYYVTVLFALFWFGLGGFAPLNAHDGLILCSLAFSVVYLDKLSQDEDERNANEEEEAK